MRTIPSVLAIAIISMLPACAFSGPQSQAGLTSAHIVGQKFDEAGRVIERCEATINDGKERSDTSLSGTVCGSQFSYTAHEVRAFRAFEIRAEVEQASIAAFGKIVPEIVETGMSAALTAFTGATVVGAARDAVASKAALDVVKLKIDAAKVVGGVKPGGALP